MKEQQQVTARQLQQQQKAQALASDSPDVQQSALADAREEVAGHGDEDRVSVTPPLGLSLETPGGGENEAMPADTPDRAVIDQSVSQLSAADPAEASPQTDPEPMVETPAPPRLSEAAELSVDERIDVFLEAIRNRSWEQTNRQPVNWADGAKPDIQLPPSGYSEIGGIGSGKVKGQMLNAGRTFYPGQAYEPEVSDFAFALELHWSLALAWNAGQGWPAGCCCKHIMRLLMQLLSVLLVSTLQKSYRRSPQAAAAASANVDSTACLCNSQLHQQCLWLAARKHHNMQSTVLCTVCDSSGPARLSSGHTKTFLWTQQAQHCSGKCCRLFHTE